MKSVRVLVLVLLALGLLLAGCGKEEAPPSPSPTATPPPPPKVTGNKHCQDQGGTCQITSDDIYAESQGEGASGHKCDPWDDNEAIYVTKGNAGNGKFKKIHVIAGANHKQFTISLEACPGSSGNPFPAAKNKNNDDWDSGDLDPKTADKSHYHLIMTEKTKKGMKKSDPHIVVGGLN
jgi:type 1 fimbria pilin